MKHSSWRFVATILILAGTLIASRLGELRPPESLPPLASSIAGEIAGWRTLKDSSLEPRTVTLLAASDYLSRAYRKGDKRLDLFVALYAQQRARESMHSPKNCLPATGWEISQTGFTMVPLVDRQIKVNKYSIQNSGERALVLYWYQSKRRIVANEYLGKILLIRDAVLNGTTAGSMVRIVLPDEPGALEHGIEFAAGVIPEVQRCFLK